MSEPFLIGLVGARGYVGRELIRLVARHPEMMLAYAVSREWAGRPVREIAPEIADESVFEEMAPAAVARRRADAVVLALPDGAGAAYVDAIEADAPHRVVVDLSADRRFDDAWSYGLPETRRVLAHAGREPAGPALAGATRIANPGCYATAMQIALAPLVGQLGGGLGGTPSVFGVSGYSGAGTTPGPRNDPARLADNLLPYALVGHKHEREATRHLGAAVRFSPHVHPAFRGLCVTVDAPLAEAMDAAALRALFEEAYADEPMIRLADEPPGLADGAGIEGAIVGGFAVGASDAGEGRRAALVVAIDNLLKGAASQAVQNLNLALGLDEMAGLRGCAR